VAIGASHLQIPELREGDEAHTGESAYALLLEIVCGLRSPVVGETEVFGQFKAFIDKQESEERPVQLINFLRRIATDAKKIRHDYLRDLGSQSYGSLVRKEVRGANEIHLIGFGHLAQEIIPWLKKSEIPVTVHVRRPEQVETDLPVVSLADPKKIGGVVVVAAPVNSQDFAVWLGEHAGRLEKVIDLRGESQADPIRVSAPVVDLQEVMSRLANLRDTHSALIEKVRGEIRGLATAAAQSVRVRPQGWDDLCA
jgi:glutamyl-tRNA reductase